jgi:RNA polymerase sigma-70 factor (ECF subfamily)
MTGTYPATAAVPDDAAAGERGLAMTEQQFRQFHAETARPLKAYLSRITGQAHLADDLLQEAYYRMLRANLPPLDAGQLRSYLYKVATNLARDHFRRPARQETAIETAQIGDGRDSCSTVSLDMQRVLSAIAPREREMVWLAYAEGASHREIAEITGLKEASIRPLLYRVRRKLAGLLREAGFDGGSK